MRTIGIHQENSTLYIATVDRGRLLETKTCSIEDVKPFDSHTITGLGFDKVLRRELSFRLKRRSQIFSAIPFQAEGVVPYPLAEAILYPEFIRSKKGTDVVLLATKRIFLEQHVAEFQRLGIDPIQVATLPTALAQWAHFSYPDKTEVAIFYDRCCVVCQKGKIVFSQSFEEVDRLKAFLQNKFPQAEHLQADAMAVAIGLALDKVQLRTGSFASETGKRLKKQAATRYVAIALILAGSVWGLGEGLLAYHRYGLEKRLGGGPLKEKMAATLQELQEKKKELPLSPPSERVSDIMAWLALKSSDVDVISLHYSFLGSLTVKIELSFLAPTPAAARGFREQILRDPLVNTKSGVTLNPDQDQYKMVFCLRESS